MANTTDSRTTERIQRLVLNSHYRNIVATDLNSIPMIQRWRSKVQAIYREGLTTEGKEELSRLRNNAYGKDYLLEEIEDGQEISENIPEDKEDISIKFEKNKKGITLNIPKLDPIVTIYNLQDDVVLIDTSKLTTELITKKEFLELMTVKISKEEPVILKDGFYISMSGVKIDKNKVKANCYKINNSFKVTEKEFFDGTLAELIAKKKKLQNSRLSKIGIWEEPAYDYNYPVRIAKYNLTGLDELEQNPVVVTWDEITSNS